jgi:hypothetical protein
LLFVYKGNNYFEFSSTCNESCFFPVAQISCKEEKILYLWFLLSGQTTTFFFT